MLPSRLALVLLVAARAAARSCLSDGTHTAGALRAKLWAPGSGYDRDTRPALAAALASGSLSAPVEEIAGTFRIENLITVDAKEGTVELRVREKWTWKDSRLAYPSYQDGGCFPREYETTD